MFPTTWRNEIEQEMAAQGDAWADIEASTLSDDDLDRVFDAGYGGAEGVPFTVWTKRRVYFPSVYDGAEAAESVSRIPDGVPTRHIGG